MTETMHPTTVSTLLRPATEEDLSPYQGLNEFDDRPALIAEGVPVLAGGRERLAIVLVGLDEDDDPVLAIHLPTVEYQIALHADSDDGKYDRKDAEDRILKIALSIVLAGDVLLPVDLDWLAMKSSAWLKLEN